LGKKKKEEREEKEMKNIEKKGREKKRGRKWG